MTKVLREKTWLRDIIIISITYILIHGFMLILTGTFHDDWLSFFKDTVTKDMEGLESGRPYYSFVIEVVWNLPGYGYRILAFITYWISYLLIYATFYRITCNHRSEAVLITLICMAVPVNDARVLLANYPYGLGMMLFYAGLCLLAGNIRKLQMVPIRAVILGLFFLSFTLNSNLVLYGVVILYLMVVFKIRYIYKYLDFIFLPVAFYLLNHQLFPVYGAYANYNVVTIDKLKWAVLSIPVILADTLVTFIKLICPNNTRCWITIFISLIALMTGRSVLKLFFDKSNAETIYPVEDEKTLGSRSLAFLFGIVTLIAGVFPYAVVRQDTHIAFTGIQGRDSIQAGLGLALMLIGGVNKKIRAGVVAFILVAGVFHFNTWYLNYQMEWYRQLFFQNEIEKIEDIKKGGNYLVKCVPESIVGDRRFYTWSGNTSAATGRKNVFALNGNGDKWILSDSKHMKSILSHYPMYTDYIDDHSWIDGEVELSVDMSRKDALALKALEMFDHHEFERRISTIGESQYSSCVQEAR